MAASISARAGRHEGHRSGSGLDGTGLSHIAWVEKQVEETIDYEFTYPMMNGVMHLIKELNATIVSQEFDNVCKVSLRIRQRDAQLLRNRLAQLSFQ